MAIIPLKGDKLECIELTEPFEAAVVVVDHRTLFVIPNRVSLPSINGKFPNSGFDEYSANKETNNPVISNMNIVVNIAAPLGGAAVVVK